MFSVIIPAYNSEKTIEKTLDSLQNQTKPELIQEVIIINDDLQTVRKIRWSSIKAVKIVF